MSLEQFALPNVQIKKPWMYFNGTAVSTNFLIVGPPVIVSDDLKSIGIDNVYLPNIYEKIDLSYVI